MANETDEEKLAKVAKRAAMWARHEEVQALQDELAAERVAVDREALEKFPGRQEQADEERRTAIEWNVQSLVNQRAHVAAYEKACAALLAEVKEQTTVMSMQVIALERIAAALEKKT